MLAPRLARRSSRSTAQPRSAGEQQVAALFDLEDEAERFMLGAIQRFHSEPRGLYQPLAIGRTDALLHGQRHRLVVEAAEFRGARPQWMLIIWNIDAVSITFEHRPTRGEILELFRAVAGSSR